MSHSPGPWRAVKLGSTHTILDANGMIRAVDVGPPSEDAALIAAAPEMAVVVWRAAALYCDHPASAAGNCMMCLARDVIARLPKESAGG